MKARRKRSHFEMALSILRLIASEGDIVKTRIMGRCNLSYSTCQKYLVVLTGWKLIENGEGGNGKVYYRITYRGKQFLKGMQNLDRLVPEQRIFVLE